MSYERPDMAVLAELEQLLEAAANDLANWRRRCLKSESELQELRSKGGVRAGPELAQTRQRVVDLENENAALRQRIEAARARLRSLTGRLAFLAQDAEHGAA